MSSNTYPPDSNPLNQNLLDNVSALISQHNFSSGHMLEEEHHNMQSMQSIQSGSGTKAKPKAKPKAKAPVSPKTKTKFKPKEKEEKKVKLIDTFKKTDLEKIAKKHDVSLKARDGTIKTKEQLFASLKRKSLV